MSYTNSDFESRILEEDEMDPIDAFLIEYFSRERLHSPSRLRIANCNGFRGSRVRLLGEHVERL